ncbi:hypothetical protein Cob_v004690 [Colletotrichum orbiculare MAFF 240422]|uniref:Rhodopsin domain-containing protein n=1 Tax=Colletotrichum orbiculare (strain 104-T / ATCC 96160 / CBS 514.97 / LARS 414 / MAFF 240422) TaxID=1213857 RepID=N4VPI6_COLOR|nr:hypothetical protein Cob_v004690 [Colletotrichum orbiculare MAFF 240422]
MVTNDAVIRNESNGPLVSGIAVGFVTASAIVLAFRLYTRLFLLKTAGKDDWSVLLAMVFAVIVTVATCFEVKYGMGKHKEKVTDAETYEQLKFLLIVVLHYNIGMNVIKVSFLFQYRRIFVSQTVQRVCLWAIIFVIVWACLQASLLGTSCLPMAAIVPSTASFCLDTLPVWYFSSAMSMATDVMIFCIPLPSVFRLKLPAKQKALLCGVFSLGFLVCVISVYRLFTLRTAVESEDPPWDNIGAAIWSVVELNTSIICASLPTLRPLLAKWLPGAGLSSAQQSTGYPAYTPPSRVRRGTFGGLESSPQEVSTEELVLKNMTKGQVEDVPPAWSVTGDSARSATLRATSEDEGDERKTPGTQR